MKLRLEENALRLRLADDEARQFAQTGRLAQTVQLGPAPGQALRYELIRLPERPAADPSALAGPPEGLRLRYDAGHLVVEMPAALAREWLESKKVGVAAQIPVGEGGELRIVVEKDLGYQH